MRSQPFFVPAAIFVVVAIPLVLRLIPPNRWYGFRTPRALASSEAWYADNRRGGSAVLLASLFYLLVARLHPWRKGAPDDFRVWLVHLAAFVVPLLAALVSTARRSRTR